MGTDHDDDSTALCDFVRHVLHAVNSKGNVVNVHEHALRVIGTDKSVVQTSSSVLRVFATVADKHSLPCSAVVGWGRGEAVARPGSWAGSGVGRVQFVGRGG